MTDETKHNPFEDPDAVLTLLPEMERRYFLTAPYSWHHTLSKPFGWQRGRSINRKLLKGGGTSWR